MRPISGITIRELQSRPGGLALTVWREVFFPGSAIPLELRRWTLRHDVGPRAQAIILRRIL